MKNPKIILLFGLLLGPCAPVFSQNYETHKLNGKYGVKQYGSDEWVIKPVHEYLRVINDTLVIVGTGRKTEPVAHQKVIYKYVIDEEGNETGESSADTVTFYDTVMVGQRVGVMYMTGKMLVPVKYSFINYNAYEQTIKAYKGGTPFPFENNPDSWRVEMDYIEMRYISGEYHQYFSEQYVKNAPFDVWYGKKNVIADVDSITDLPSGTPGMGVYQYVYKKGSKTAYSKQFKPFTAFDFNSIEKIIEVGSHKVFVVRDGEKFRFKNENGKEYIKGNFDSFYSFYNGFFVNRGGKMVFDTVDGGNYWSSDLEIYVPMYALKFKMYGGIIYFLNQEMKAVVDFDSVSFTLQSGVEHVAGKYVLDFGNNDLLIYKKKKTGIISLREPLVPARPLYDEVSVLKSDYGYDPNSLNVLVRNGKKYGMLSWIKDTTLIPVKYDTIIRHGLEYYFLTLNKRVALQHMGGAKLNRDFDSIVTWSSANADYYSSYSDDRNNHFTGYDKGIGYTINANLKVVDDSVKQWKRLCPGRSNNTWLVTKNNGLTGVWNQETDTWITKPWFNTVSEKTINNVCVVERKVNNQRLKGLLRCDGTMLWPAELKEVNYITEFRFYKATNAAGKEIFFDDSSRVVEDGARKLALSMMPALQRNASKNNFTYAWKSYNGPVGADATALMVDKKGDYWLGTGSSGGVYHSTDKGKTWSARIKGTGPVHVVDMLTVNDSVLMLASYPATRPFYFRKNKYRAYNKMYYWLQAGKTWVELDTLNTNRLDSVFHKRWINYQMPEEEYYNWDNPLPGWSKNYSIFTDSLGRDAFVIKKTNGEDSLRITSFIPKDISYKARYPMGQLDKQNLYLLTNSGSYRLNPAKNESVRMGETGLVATDITRIIPKQNAVYAVVGQNSIWKYQEGKWKRLVHMADNEASGTIRSPGYLDEKSVNVSDGGKVFFNSGTHAYIISENGEIKKLNQEFVHGIFTGENNMIMSMPTDIENYYSNQYYIVEYSLSDSVVKKEYGQVGYRRHQFVKAGDTSWLIQKEHENYVTALSQSFVEKSSQPAHDLSDNSFTTGARNSVMMKKYGKNALLVWNEKANGWAEIELDSMHSLSAATMTADGKIFYATNYRYQSGGCSEYDGYEGKPRLYYVHYNGIAFVSVEIENSINPRILTLQAHETDPDLIYVGTSGSGLYELRLDFK